LFLEEGKQKLDKQISELDKSMLVAIKECELKYQDTVQQYLKRKEMELKKILR
jgi:hypothetical protein